MHSFAASNVPLPDIWHMAYDCVKEEELKKKKALRKQLFWLCKLIGLISCNMSKQPDWQVCLGGEHKALLPWLPLFLLPRRCACVRLSVRGCTTMWCLRMVQMDK